MSVDVSKAAVDARVAAREAKRADLRTIGLALLIVGAIIVGLRLYEGVWMPLGWNILFVVVALGFAGGRLQQSKRT